MTAIRLRPALFLAVAAVLATGCGSLARELERERNPARTTPPAPVPPTPPPAPPPSAAPTGPGPTPPTAPSRAPTAPPGPAEPCPRPGVRITPGPVNGAMGLRAMTVTLTNCGTRPYKLNGYPAVRVLDEERDAYDIEVAEGTDGIPMAQDDPGPEPLTLRPGESARSSLTWRAMSTDATTTYLEIAPDDGARPQTVETADGPLDLVDTGKLGTTAWQRTG